MTVMNYTFSIRACSLSPRRALFLSQGTQEDMRKRKNFLRRIVSPVPFSEGPVDFLLDVINNQGYGGKASVCEA